MANPSHCRTYLAWVRLGPRWTAVIRSAHAATDDRAAIASCRAWLRANRHQWDNRGIVSRCVLPEGMSPDGDWKEW